MDISMFMTKRDWISIFTACCLIILLLLLALIGKAVIWIFIILLFIICCFAFYFAWIKKYDVEDNELESMLNDLKEGMFGGKKNG